MDEAFFRYGWKGSYMAAKEKGYERGCSDFIYAARRMELAGGQKTRKSPGNTTEDIRSCLSRGGSSGRHEESVVLLPERGRKVRRMRALGNKSSIELLRERLTAA